jgi:hypothetical protein
MTILISGHSADRIGDEATHVPMRVSKYIMKAFISEIAAKEAFEMQQSLIEDH